MKVDEWRSKVSQQVGEKNTISIKHQNDVVQGCPTVIVVGVDYLKDQQECLNAMRFEILIIDVALKKNSDTWGYLVSLREKISSVIIVRNFECVEELNDFYTYLQFIEPSIFLENIRSKFEKRYNLSKKTAQSSLEELSFILNQYFLSDQSRGSFLTSDEISIKNGQSSVLERFNVEASEREKKELKMFERRVNSSDLNGLFEDNFYFSEELDDYFSLVNSLKDKCVSQLYSNMNTLHRRTLVITSGDAFLCRLYKKYNQIDFVSTDSDLTTLEIHNYGQILIPEVYIILLLMNVFVDKFAYSIDLQQLSEEEEADQIVTCCRFPCPTTNYYIGSVQYS